MCSFSLYNILKCPLSNRRHAKTIKNSNAKNEKDTRAHWVVRMATKSHNAKSIKIAWANFWPKMRKTQGNTGWCAWQPSRQKKCFLCSSPRYLGQGHGNPRHCWGLEFQDLIVSLSQMLDMGCWIHADDKGLLRI